MVKRHGEMQRKIDQHQNFQVHYTQQGFKEFCCQEISFHTYHTFHVERAIRVLLPNWSGLATQRKYNDISP